MTNDGPNTRQQATTEDLQRQMEEMREEWNSFQGKHDREMAELKEMVAQILRSSTAGRPEISSAAESQRQESPIVRSQVNSERSNPNFVPGGQITTSAGGSVFPGGLATRLTKVEFPKFHGTLLRPWLYKCEQEYKPNFDAIGYRYETGLGDGNNSVYLVSNKNGQHFALKLVTLERGEITPNVARELSTMFNVQHDNIVRLYKAFTHLGSICLIMELMESDLREHLLIRKINLQEVKVYLRQIISAVAYLHNRKIIHRDLKPENLLMTPRPQDCSVRSIKLADFGLSRGFFKGERLTPQVTTMSYRAPEVLLGSDHYNTAIDMWSIGCIFWDLVMYDESSLQTLFDADELESEEDIIDAIFMKLGCPTESAWPGVTSLPKFPLFTEGYTAEGNLEIDPRFTELGADLLKRLLCVNPLMRITADEALKHPFLV